MSINLFNYVFMCFLLLHLLHRQGSSRGEPVVLLQPPDAEPEHQQRVLEGIGHRRADHQRHREESRHEKVYGILHRRASLRD